MADPIKHAEHCATWRKNHKETISDYNKVYFRCKKLKEAGKDTAGMDNATVLLEYDKLVAARKMNRIVKIARPIDTSLIPPMPKFVPRKLTTTQ